MPQLKESQFQKDRVLELNQAIDSGSLYQVRQMIKTLPTAGIAHLLESSPPRTRRVLWQLIDKGAEGEVIQYLHEDLQNDILSELNAEEVAELTVGLEDDDLADILQTLPDKMTNEVLSLMNSRDRGRVENVLDFPEESAGGLMNTDVITVRAENSIELVMRYLRFLRNLPKNTDDIYVVSKNDEYLGILPITKILTSDTNMTVREVMDTEFQPIQSNTNQIEVFNLFKTNDLLTAPIVNEKNMLVGRITVDDIIEIAADEVEQDFRGLAQIEEDIFASPRKSIENRLLWLSINLITAIAAAASISVFENVLEEIVYAAILMPIVASMGGIAATQTLGIYIRAEALRQLNRKNIRYLFRREFIVALANCFVFSIAIYLITVFWFGNSLLSFAISAAMIFNLLAAAIFGFSLPHLLRKFGYDPAIAGSVVITTVTDILGFVSFLGIVSFIAL